MELTAVVARTGAHPDRDVLVVTGLVKDWSHGMGRVEVTIAGKPFTILAARCGRMKMHHILVLPGDTVTVEISPFDMGRGRIVRRDLAPR